MPLHVSPAPAPDLTAHVHQSLAASRRGGPRAATSAVARSAARPGAGLGKTTKSASPAPDPDSLHSQRRRRFRLQETAGDLLGGRLAYCGRRRRRAVENVRLLRAADGSAYATGLQRCGSVHSCPVCAARIAQTRRMEAITALASWRASGGVVSMLTLTLPHHIGQSLSDVLEAVTYCTRYLNSGKNALSKLLAPYGYVGQIRALEVTHGGNGWHPHVHVLVLTTTEVPEVIQDVLKARWEAAAVAGGWARPDWRVGATWQDGRHAAAYVNKAGTWGMAEEVTMSASKKGSGSGRTPFELLQDAALGDAEAARLFQEYGETLRGRRQQFWSRGLKARFGLQDVTDEEIVDSEDDDQELAEEVPVLAEVAPDYWRLVVKFGERAEVLRAAECGGQVAVDAVCSWLHQRYMAALVA